MNELEAAIDRAAGELPDGWTIEIAVERGSAWIRLEDPSGEGRMIDGADKTLAEQVEEALRVAKEEGA